MNNGFMEELIIRSTGIFESSLYKPKSIGKIKLKDIFKYKIYFLIRPDKIYFYVYKDEKNNDYISDVNDNFIDLYSSYFSKCIYNSSYYKIKFKQLLYSLNIEDKNYNFNYDLEQEINIYSLDDEPIIYYKLNNNLFENIKLISHILYKYELLDYINTFDKQINYKSVNSEKNNSDYNNVKNNVWW
jgi:hypothetical protein